MAQRPHASDIIKQVVPPLTVWAIETLLKRPKISKAVEKLDKRARKNVSKNRTMLVAGVAVIAAGIGLIATASSTKK
ncbi:MAG TPA: hypothetical protein VGR95_21970 [Thermoanaerobaculia bacterium]|jgi:hypothetical protein|nr:hypothetical protein [Thermoanaerobaculia bacterium]